MKDVCWKLGILVVLGLNCASLDALSRIKGQIINADRNKPVAGLVLEADVNDAGVITSKAQGYLQQEGGFEISLPSTSKPGSKIRLHLISKGWLFVDHADGQITVPDDGNVGAVKVAPFGSITLLSADRLRYLCRKIASGKRVIPINIGKVEFQITPDSVISAMAVETGVSVKAFTEKLVSWANDPNLDAGDRALAASSQGDFKNAIRLAKEAIKEKEQQDKLNAKEEALYYSVMGNAMIDEGQFVNAYDAFSSALAKDSSFVEAHLKLGYLCAVPVVAKEVHEDSSVYKLPDIASWRAHRDENASLLQKCGDEPFKHFRDAWGSSRSGNQADETKEAYVLFALVGMAGKLVGVDLISVLDEEDDNEKRQGQEKDAFDFKERCRWLLKNSNASHSSDLPMTIYYAAEVLTAVESGAYDNEEWMVLTAAIDLPKSPPMPFAVLSRRLCSRCDNSCFLPFF
ncbi:MAG TPA: hypothetical protein VGK01_18400 [Candidatus Angelobacter sp.]